MATWNAVPARWKLSERDKIQPDENLKLSILHLRSIHTDVHDEILVLPKLTFSLCILINAINPINVPVTSMRKHKLPIYGLIQLSLIWNNQCIDTLLPTGYVGQPHIEPETKWPTFSRRHFEMGFLEWKYTNLEKKIIEVFVFHGFQ